MRSNSAFPELPGLGWDISRKATFETQVQSSISGREDRATYWSHPIWEMSLKYNVLRNFDGFAELDQIVGLFLQCRGRFKSFLFADPSDNGVTAQIIAIGDGSTKDFQLLRNFGGFAEPVMWTKGITGIYVNAAPVSYALGQYGIVTLSAPPPVGAVVTWAGEYYYRARFVEDSAEYNEFSYKLFNMQTLSLRACLGDKL